MNLLLATLATATALALHVPAQAGMEALEALEALDVNASTDDHSVNLPTSWWTYTNVTADQVGTFLSQNGARLTEIEVYSVTSGVPRFTVRMVKNSGAYAVPGWWWYYGLTAAQVTSYVNANNGRLIELEPYDIGGGQIRFAVVMVSNTAGAARAWSYLMGVSSAQITDHINSSGHRLIDLDSYTEGGVKKYTAAFVANTGADAKSWQWWINQTPASIASKVSSFQGRIVKLERQSNGTYNFIQVKNTGSDNSAWWYQYGFASMTDLNNYGLQVASRPIDITTYVDGNGARRYDAVFIDNANASTRRMRDLLGKTFLDANGNPTKGIFESYLKQVNGAVKVDLNSARRAETGSSVKALYLLHAMKQVELGLDTLNSAFTYYEYDPTRGPYICPTSSKEVAANERQAASFEAGLDQMMSISDNRAARGTLLRYGGSFSTLNSTAAASGMTSTTLRHDDGCAYWNPTTFRYDPASLRNDTTAANLAHLYEGVWNQSLLGSAHSARDEFLESANPTLGAGALQAIINEEAAKQGKTAQAAAFGALVRTWGNTGKYNTCLPDDNGGCGQKVIVRSGTGLVRLPVYTQGFQTYRDYAFGHLISDTPVPCWEDTETPGTNCPADVDYTQAHDAAANELWRDEVREALKTW
ncbi:serine hydrolase [Ideonella sp. DXS29W]|uniref:beta-lactamase n=1 Tax=Ideonella lacteola TaxID=2984193 RepID=A0ABU9BYC0_9BURK